MRKGWFSSIAALAASAGIAWGQANVPYPANGPVMSLPTDPVMFGGQVIPAGNNGIAIPPPVVGGIAPGSSDPVAFPGGMGGPPSYPPSADYGPFDLSGQNGQPGPFPVGHGHQSAPSDPNRLPHVWAGAEYLMWFMSPQPSPYPLITTGSPLSQGVLGRPTTHVLYGGEDIGFNVVSGFRVTAGTWFDVGGRVGFEGSGFAMENKAVIYDAISNPRGTPTFARPYIDASTGQQATLLASFPELALGTINVVTESQLWGTEGSLVFNWHRSKPTSEWGLNINGLLGGRYINLQEQIAIASGSNLIVGNSAPFAGQFFRSPAVIGVSDSFLTRNEFYGGQFGLQSELRHGRVTLKAMGKVGIGNMHQRLDVNGFSNITTGVTGLDGSVNTQTTAVQGGLFANSENIGRYINDEFVVIPEGQISLGCNVTSFMNVSLGYNFLYLSQVIRPGEQINPMVNTSLVPTSFAYGQSGFTRVPPPSLQSSSFYIHGLTAAIEFRY